MADTGDYLEVYKKFFEHFAATVNPNDQLPVKVAGYNLSDNELVGEIVDWTLQYLNQKKCPPSLIAHITRIVIDEMRQLCKGHPAAFRNNDNSYQPLKLMQAVTRKVDEVCLRYRDNGLMSTLPPPGPELPVSTCAIKNTRRCMEDRHVIIEDFHGVFNIEDPNPASYYAVFDGHAGSDAATYSVSHLHQFLAESPHYPTDPVKALKDAFLRTDRLFIEKSMKEHLRSGTTAVCALLRRKEKKLYIAWLGDSQAIIVSEGKAVQIVNPHKPDREDERQRIEDMGGCVFFWGTWRVDGQLAVSRAIGDPDYKPYVTAEPDVTVVDLTGNEDFLVLACDGLWDFVREEEAVAAVYEQLHQNPGDLEAVSQRLVQLSKQQGSTDNISVIIVFLAAPTLLVSRSLNESRQWPSLSNGPQYQTVSTMEKETSTNPFTNGASEEVSCQKGLLLDLGANDSDTFKQNGKKTPDLFFLGCPPNGKMTEDDDLGPETDVDAVDDVQLSGNPFENNALLHIQPKLLDFETVEKPRQETPTPPADEVTGVAGLVPDNVAESGEESEDEWNYYKVEPREKPSETQNQEQQLVTPPIVEQPAEKAVSEESTENMESQLNPNAAEFVPSPTQHKSVEQFLKSSTPDVDPNVLPPLPSKVEESVPKVPSAIDSLNGISPDVKLPDLLNGQKLDDECHVEDQSGGPHATVSDEDDDNLTRKVISVAFEELDQLPVDTEMSRDNLCSTVDRSQELNEALSVLESRGVIGAPSDPFVEPHDLRDAAGDSSHEDIAESSENMESQLIPNAEKEIGIESSPLTAADLSKDPSTFHDVVSSVHMADKAREPIHISFELQKDIAPEMESQPELVKLNSDDNSLGFEGQETVMEEKSFGSDVLEVEEIPIPSLVKQGIPVPLEMVEPLIPELDDSNLRSTGTDDSFQEDSRVFLSDKIEFSTLDHQDVCVPDLVGGVALEDTSNAEASSPNTLQTPPLTPTLIRAVEESKPDKQNEIEVIKTLPEIEVKENPVLPAVEKSAEVNVAVDTLEGIASEILPEVSVGAESSDVLAVTAAAAVVATVATAVAAGADITENKIEELSGDKKTDMGVIESKKEATLPAKKPGMVKTKKPLPDKAKPSGKVIASQKPAQSKTATSPSKPGPVPPVTKTLPKKPLSTAPQNRLTKPPTPTSNATAGSIRPKTNGIPPKSSPGLPKPRPAVTSSGSPVIDSGKAAAKRPEPASNKVSTGTSIASKTRPISAPKTMKPAVSKIAPTNIRPSTASANGSAAKPKVSLLSPRPKSGVQSKVTSVKEGKESVNKQISSSRISSLKPSPASNVTRTVSQSTTRKVESKSVANSTSVLKTTTTSLKTTSKVGVKKSPVTSVTSSSSPKTNVSAKSQNQESIEEVTSVINNEVKSDPVMFDNPEIAE